MTTGERLEASEDLWAAYRAEPTEALRHQLVLQYSPLVKYVARTTCKHHKPCCRPIYTDASTMALRTFSVASTRWASNFTHL